VADAQEAWCVGFVKSGDLLGGFGRQNELVDDVANLRREAEQTRLLVEVGEVGISGLALRH
jgi:hypothetical protein